VVTAFCLYVIGQYSIQKNIYTCIHLLCWQSDVWALGCCVYEMATLKHAFNGKDMNALMYRILRGKVPSRVCLY